MFRSLFLAFLISASAPIGASALDFPPAPTDYVYDNTGVVDGNLRQALYQTLRREDQRSGNQVLVAVFKSLEGEDAVDYVNRLFKKWNPGQKGKDNGVILAVFLNDRKVRIEVGYGLEPVLTDAMSKRIIEDEIIPRFRAGQVAEGIYAGTVRLVKTIEDPTSAAKEPIRRGKGFPKSIGFALLVLLIITLNLLDRFTSFTSGGRHTYYRRRSGGGPFGGLGGGGFGGGGGFSGGGGRSGGGGASGSW